MATRKGGKGRALRRANTIEKVMGDIPIHITMCLEIENSYTQIILAKLREREEQLVRDQLDGLDVYVAGSADLILYLTAIFNEI